MSMTVEVVEVVGLRLPCCGTVRGQHGWVALLTFRGSSLTNTVKGRNVLCHNCGKTCTLPLVYGDAQAARRAGDTVAGGLPHDPGGHRAMDYLFIWQREHLLLPGPAAAS